MEKHTLHVSIIGGGIGGLAAASALQRQGIEVTVFERNPELREIGAGLTLWANGVQVLQQLGLTDALTAVSARLTHFECWSWRGKRLGSMRLDTIERRVGAPSLGIHRADLLRLLADAVDRGSIHLHAHCVGFRSEQGTIIAHFADGQQQQTDLLVGADGLYSVIREQLLGQRPPRYSGYTRFSWGRPLRGAARLPRHFQRDVGARSALWHAADWQRAGVLVRHAQLPGRRTGPRRGMEVEALPTLWGLA